MSDDLSPRVTDLLEETASAVESIDPTTEDLESVMADAGLFESAAEAASLFEDESPKAILESLGLGELPDGSEPETVPEAIARGDESRVADLRALATLASLDSDAGDSDLEAAYEKLEDTVATGGGDGTTGGPSEDDGRETDEAAGGDDESEGGVTESIAAAADDAVEELTDSSEDGSLEDRLEAAVRSSVDGMDEEVRAVRERLEGLREDEGSSASDGEGSSASEDERDEAGASEDERDETGADGGDDGDGEESRLGGRSSTPRRATMHSTMAPPPGDRADMRHSTRHSTMPDRT